MPKKKAKHRRGANNKRSESTVSRRDVLKIGAAAGAVTVLAPKMLTSRKAFAAVVQEGAPPAEPVICGASPVNSPATTPFRDNFAAPFPAIPQDLSPAPTKESNLAAGEADRANHQRWEEFPVDVQYEHNAMAGLHTFHADYSPSYGRGLRQP